MLHLVEWYWRRISISLGVKYDRFAADFLHEPSERTPKIDIVLEIIGFFSTLELIDDRIN